MDTILTETKSISKLRPNLWQLPSGHVVGYGALSAPGGLYYCFSCNAADCSHSRTIEARWLSGEDSVEDDEAIPFDGSVPDEPLYYDDEELVFASSADLYGLNEVTL